MINIELSYKIILNRKRLKHFITVQTSFNETFPQIIDLSF